MNTPGSEYGETLASNELTEILKRNARRYEALSRAGTALTEERLAEIGLNASGDIIEKSLDAGVSWPDEESAVRLASDSDILAMLNDKKAAQNDRYFAHLVARQAPEGAGQTQGLNNFCALLWVNPFFPREDDTFHDLIASSISFADVTHGTKPYLLRAQLLVPELMDSMRTTMRRPENYGIDNWRHAIARGVSSPESETSQAILTGSRLAFLIMANLMRRDDRFIQDQLLKGSAAAQEITDPIIELCE